MGYVGGMVHGNTVSGIACVDGMVRESTAYSMVRLRYGTMVRYRGCIVWLNLPGGMVCFQYIRSVRVECVVRISSGTTYIDHWSAFENKYFWSFRGGGNFSVYPICLRGRLYSRTAIKSITFYSCESHGNRRRHVRLRSRFSCERH